MAKQQETVAAKQPEIPSQLLAIGAPVVVTGSGDRIQLGGELSAEHREALGDAKVRSLWNAGHLQSQEQLDAADEARTHLNDQQKAMRGHINPNFGTPSMTPEAAAKNEAPALAQGARPSDTGQRTPGGALGGGNSKREQTAVANLGLDPRIVESLQAAELNTVADVLRYGEDNDGLTSIEGIGEASEKKIQDAIDEVLPPA